MDPGKWLATHRRLGAQIAKPRRHFKQLTNVIMSRLMGPDAHDVLDGTLVTCAASKEYNVLDAADPMRVQLLQTGWQMRAPLAISCMDRALILRSVTTIKPIGCAEYKYAFELVGIEVEVVAQPGVTW